MSGRAWPDGSVVVVEDVWGQAFGTLAARWEVVRQPEAWREPRELSRLLEGARALVVRNRTAVDRRVLEEASSLELVARAGVGLDNVDLGAADDLGVVVVSPRGANARSVAELALALALALARDVPAHDRAVRAGRWERSQGIELAGRCWGVVGLGATGRATACLARAVGMDVVGFDPYLASSADLEEVGERVQRLRGLLARADVVSLHVPLTPETAGMVGETFLAALKPGALLVNVGRGGLVDERALLGALESGRLGGAGLDLRAEEPPLPGRLEAHPRVVSTPHVAGLTVEAQERISSVLAADIEAVLGGGSASSAVGRWSRPSRPRP